MSRYSHASILLCSPFLFILSFSPRSCSPPQLFYVVLFLLFSHSFSPNLLSLFFCFSQSFDPFSLIFLSLFFSHIDSQGKSETHKCYLFFLRCFHFSVLLILSSETSRRNGLLYRMVQIDELDK
ncbi:hypothetical protein ABFS83_03G036700 [Erythranthe nasuta]